MRSAKAGTLLLLTIIATSFILAACGGGSSNLTVSDAWARAAMMDMATESSMDSEATQHSGSVSAAYMLIKNSGSADDRLDAVSTNAAAVAEIHTTEVDAEGVARMRPLSEGLTIPAGETVILEPGGIHVMLMDLQQMFIAGDTIDLVLSFESGTEITVTAEVRAP